MRRISGALTPGGLTGIASFLFILIIPALTTAQIPVITCPGPVNLTLNDIGLIRVPLPIIGATSVVASGGATWSNDTLRFTTAMPIEYDFAVIATNSNGADTCDVRALFPGITTKTGSIDGETWTKSESPYCIVDSCRVGLLTVEPGVEIVFFGNFDLEIVGGITAVGTAADSIRFRSHAGTVNWGRIYLNESSRVSDLRYCVFSGSRSRALYFYNADARIDHCTFRNNIGGGLYSNHPLNLNYCDFVNNDITTNTHTYGGGIYANANLNLTFCRFIDNDLSTSAGGFDGVSCGGGLYINGTANLRRCVFRDNSTYSHSRCTSNPCLRNSFSYGGAVYISGNSEITNCIIQNNSATGAITAYGGSVFVRGSGLYVASGTVNVTNCTVVGNNCEGVRSDGGATFLQNSILWNNGSSQHAGAVTRKYCCIQDADTTGGNPDSIENRNPSFFVDSLGLMAGSPCIDAGNPDPQYDDGCFPPSRGTVRNDMGAYGGPGACLGVCSISGVLIDGCSSGSMAMPSVPVALKHCSPDTSTVRLDTTDSQGLYHFAGLGDTCYSIYVWDTLVYTIDSLPTDANGLNVRHCSGWTDVAPGSKGKLEMNYALSQNFPNPFNPSTHFQLALPRASQVQVQVFNVLGQKVKELANGRLSAGNHDLTWDGRDAHGTPVSSGVYFYRMTAGEFTETRKMMLLK